MSEYHMECAAESRVMHEWELQEIQEACAAVWQIVWVRNQFNPKIRSALLRWLKPWQAQTH